MLIDSTFHSFDVNHVVYDTCNYKKTYLNNEAIVKRYAKPLRALKIVTVTY